MKCLFLSMDGHVTLICSGLPRMQWVTDETSSTSGDIIHMFEILD